MLTREQLPAGGTHLRAFAHWRHVTPAEASEVVRREVIGRGTCLPMVRFCDGLVVPVVTWRMDTLSQRLLDGRGPVLTRSVLADRLSHGRDHLAPAALEIDAFISVERLGMARRSLAAASVYAPAIAAVPRPPGADSWNVFECDYYGISVAEVDGTSARVVVQGRDRPKHPEGGVAHQRRLLEEQLFDVAQRFGATPGGGR